MLLYNRTLLLELLIVGHTQLHRRALIRCRKNALVHSRTLRRLSIPISDPRRRILLHIDRSLRGPCVRRLPDPKRFRPPGAIQTVKDTLIRCLSFLGGYGGLSEHVCTCG